MPVLVFFLNLCSIRQIVWQKLIQLTVMCNGWLKSAPNQVQHVAEQMPAEFNSLGVRDPIDKTN